MREPIGLFDSGLGGLTVLKEIHTLLPNEDLIYFGDTARCPYGSKSPKKIRKYSKEIAGYLQRKGVKLIVVACNTATACALPTLQNTFTIPIVGVVQGGAADAVQRTSNMKVGVIGTTNTIKSKVYETEIKKLNDRCLIFQKACPLFVPLVEEGWLDSSVTLQVAQKYLKGFKQIGVDTLVLGCTHYPLLQPIIQKAIGNKVRLINPGHQTAYLVKELLEERRLNNKETNQGAIKIFLSDKPRNFSKVAERFLQKDGLLLSTTPPDSLIPNGFVGFTLYLKRHIQKFINFPSNWLTNSLPIKPPMLHIHDHLH